MRCSPNINPPMKASALLENVWPITIAGQHLHLLPLNAQADFDPLKTENALSTPKNGLDYCSSNGNHTVNGQKL